MMPERAYVYREPLVEGFRRGSHGEHRKDFAITLFVDMKIDEDHARARLAFYVGGMGAWGHHFYNDYMKRLGFCKAAETIQEYFPSGDKAVTEGSVMALLLSGAGREEIRFIIKELL